MGYTHMPNERTFACYALHILQANRRPYQVSYENA